jgi:hypothetical protein
MKKTLKKSYLNNLPSPRRLMSAVFGALGMLGAITAQAQSITWSAPTTIQGDSDVSTAGAASIFAYDWDRASINVNGVNFTAPGTGITTTGFDAGPLNVFTVGTGGDADALDPFYENIINGAIYIDSTAPCTVTLQALNVGNQYQVQIWADDSRSCCPGKMETVSDNYGHSVVLSLNASGAAGGLGQYVIGSFTATATTEVINMQGAEAYAGSINAIQLRDFNTATPVFSPVAGTYVGPQTVTVTSEAGSTVFYTTDGSTPTNTSPNGGVGNGSATVTIPSPAVVTVKAYATNVSELNSAVATAVYTNLNTPAAPSFSPAAGTYIGGLSVTLTAATGTTIFYTTDGSDPTTSSSAVSGPSGTGSATATLPVPATVTIKASASNGAAYGPVATATYITTMAPQAASITWNAPASIEGDSDVSTNGVSIYAYDWNGSSLNVNGVNFTAPGTNVGLSGFDNVLPVFANGSGGQADALDPYYENLINGATYVAAPSLCTVTLENLTAGDQYQVQLWVDDSRSCCPGKTETASDTSGNSVDLSLNVSGEAGGLGQYVIGTFTATNSSEVIHLLGAEDYAGSLNAIQLRDLTTATPVFSPVAGTYLGAQTVTITSDPGSTVFYTTNGSAPVNTSLHGAIGSGSATVSLPAPATVTIEAYATNSNEHDSLVATAIYTNVNTPFAPSFSPAPGPYVGGLNVTMTAASGTTILYTTDGSNPTNSSSAASGPAGSGSASVALPVPAVVTIKACAVNGGSYSPVAAATYNTTMASQPTAITWNVPVNIGGDSDVSTNGVLTYACDWFGASISVNGVTFTAPGTNVVLAGFDGGPAYPFVSNTGAEANALDPNYATMINGAIFVDSTALCTLALQGLTVGDQYQFQIWVDDSRSCCPGKTETVSDNSGHSVDLSLNVTGVPGGLGQYVIGTFTAAYSTEAINMQGAEAYAGSINAIQLRDLTTATPVFSPVAGTYFGPQTVTITSDPGSTVFYTTNGSAPTNTSSHGAIGSGSATVNVPSPATETIQAYATNSGEQASLVATAVYTNVSTPSAPAFSPSPGTYIGGLDVTISSANGTTILYTTDGSNPTNSPSAVSGAAGSGQAIVVLPVPANETINACAVNSGSFSPVVSANYITTSPSQPGGISWNAAADIEGDSDISTAGTAVFGYDWSGSSVTVNGVSFTPVGMSVSLTGFDAGVVAFVSGTGPQADALDTSYVNLINGATYVDSTAPCTVTLQGLTVGNLYQVQIWVDDSRSCCPGKIEALSDSYGHSVLLSLNASGNAGGLGQYAIGTFAADATTEVINMQGAEPYAGSINAIQLRLLETAPLLSNTGTWRAGSFPLTFSGPSGQTYRILTTTNLSEPLSDWTQLSNGTFGSSPVTYTNTTATNSAQFYRIESP